MILKHFTMRTVIIFHRFYLLFEWKLKHLFSPSWGHPTPDHFSNFSRTNDSPRWRQREEVCCKLIATVTNLYIKVPLQMANIKWVTKICSSSHQIVFKGHFKEDWSITVAQLFHGQPFCNSSKSTNNMHYHNTHNILENIITIIVITLNLVPYISIHSHRGKLLQNWTW